jgi:hypothetical protein
MAILKRSNIAAAQDIKTETVSIPEWGGEVLVRGLTGVERDQFDKSVIDSQTKEITLDNVTAKLVAASVVDEDGNPVFDQPGDVDMLGTKSASALHRIGAVAQRLSGLTKEDVEELVKNSGSGPSAAPGSN